MLVIPVIDIRHGVVVRAVAGDRANYKPIVSPLFDGCDPNTAVRGLMALHPFPVIYVADLDGIEGRGANLTLIEQLLTGNPAAQFWVDNGAWNEADVAQLIRFQRTSVVVGSEMGLVPSQMDSFKRLASDRLILSLDHRADGFWGDPDILAECQCWPDRVIAMTLAQVGTAKGPDLATLKAIKQRHPTGHVYAAGGIASPAHLEAARQAGATGALISTALHAKTITAGDL